MNGRLIHVAGGVVAGALALLLVAGPATAAFADGGPDRVLSTQEASGQRPGFGDHIMPPRPGFGDHIQPAGGSAGTSGNAGATTATEHEPGWVSTSSVALIAGLVLAAGALGLVLTGVRRRRRLAHA